LSRIICTGTIGGMDKPKRPRGRPPIKNPATARVEFRCTPQEKAGYRRKAGAKGVSKWLKSLADREST
jgi:hypothetical protein